MPTLDDEIARHLAQAAAAGELQAAPSYGKPMPAMAGWDETPGEFRLAFKMLKDAGYAPPELALFHERAALHAQLVAAADETERAGLQNLLSAGQQTHLRVISGLRFEVPRTCLRGRRAARALCAAGR